VDGTVRVDASLKLFLLNHSLDMAGRKAAWIYVLSFSTMQVVLIGAWAFALSDNKLTRDEGSPKPIAKPYASLTGLTRGSALPECGESSRLVGTGVSPAGEKTTVWPPGERWRS
jgi:hypothetical protein